MSTVDTALNYRKLEFSLIPLEPKSKKPAISSWKKYQKEKPTLSQIRSWFSDNDLGIGIISGEVSNLIVLDIDKPKVHGWIVRQGGLDKTPWVKTSRGWHVYLRYPQGLNFTKVTPIEGLEISGNNHYVVAPPSKHPSGQRYEWIYSPNDIPLAKPRSWVKKAIKSHIRRGLKTKTFRSARFSDKAIPPKKKTPKHYTGKPASDKEKLKEQIFDHYIWEGEPKKGSNNGLFLTRLISHFRTGSEPEEAIEDTYQWSKGQVPYSKIKSAAQTTWSQGYGLKPQVINEVSELDDEESYQFTNLVAQYDGWDTHQSKQKQLSQEIVTQRIIAVTWFYNFRFTTIRQLAKAASIPYRTLYNRVREDRLPSYIKILTIPSKGVRVINLLPLILYLLSKQASNYSGFQQTGETTVTNALSSKIVYRDVSPFNGSSDAPDT